jgi:uncharacterized protein
VSIVSGEAGAYSDGVPRSPEQLDADLRAVVAGYGRLMTAYSGGVDSTLVAVVARRVLGKDKAPAVIGDSASLPRHELDEARRIARSYDIDLIEVQPGEQDDPNYQANAGDRCYYCKTHLYDALWTVADERDITHIANGTNADDLGDHRPGLDAAKEHRVVSPLLDAKLTKQDVRTLAQLYELPNADKPAAACLASRIPYGTQVTPERLTRVERAEDALRELGFVGYRVRHHEMVARIELPTDQLRRAIEQRDQIVARLNEVGYTYVTLDLAGFRSGSGNAVLHQLTVSESDR